MDQTLPRSRRLTRQSDIDACYRKGRRWNAGMLRIHVRDNGTEESRLAISVPGRLCDSVRRNRWKRMIRESFRLHRPEIGPGLDIVVVPQRPPGDLKRQDVEPVLLDLVRRHRSSTR